MKWKELIKRPKGREPEGCAGARKLPEVRV